MEENLVGYLLHALDSETQEGVESYLQEEPQAQKRLDLLRRALEPLEADRDTIEPPPGLVIRTVGRVAEQRCQDLPPPAPQEPKPPWLVGHGTKWEDLPTTPPTLTFPSAPPARAWWRRADVLVAASVLLCATLLIPPGLSALRYRQEISSCQDNLRQFHQALSAYSDHHDGEFPNVATALDAPRNVAGLVVPVLYENGMLKDNFSVHCPANGYQAPSKPPSLQTLKEMTTNDFEQLAPTLSGCYAYSLGYGDAPNFKSHRKDSENSEFLPIVSDRPPHEVAAGVMGNSPNHLGKGQNVLYSDGHVTFTDKRNVGVEQDDIFTNADKKVAAGKHRWDAVLGESKARPE